MKSHNILIEPWRESSSLTNVRGERLFRWTVTYHAKETDQAKEGGAAKDLGTQDRQPENPRAETRRTVVRYGQGMARTHAEARQAAEDFLAERGVELHWQPPASSTTRILTPRSGRPRFLQL